MPVALSSSLEAAPPMKTNGGCVLKINKLIFILMPIGLVLLCVVSDRLSFLSFSPSSSLYPKFKPPPPSACWQWRLYNLSVYSPFRSEM
uniref:Uncharacterized protein n=1 Tax=Strigamia maritima TaxID=126957 RepID=T1JBJ2_STRMM